MTISRKQSTPLESINEAVRKISGFLRGRGFEEFSNNALVHDAVVWNLETISDGIQHLARELKDRAPEVPWETFADTGLRLRHSYERDEDRILWEMIEVDLPPLAMAAKRLLEDGPSSPR